MKRGNEMKRAVSVASMGGMLPRTGSARAVAGASAPTDGAGLKAGLGSEGGAGGLASPLRFDSENIMAGVDALPDELEMYLPQAVQALKVILFYFYVSLHFCCCANPAHDLTT